MVGLDSRGQGNEPSLPSMLVISTYGSTGNLLLSTSLLEGLGDQIELERISKLEYSMRTKDRTTCQTRAEATQNAGRWLARFFFNSFFFNFFITIMSINNFKVTIVCVLCLQEVNQVTILSVYRAFSYSFT